MKLLILSDLHLEIHGIELPAVEFDVAILAGDISRPGLHGVHWAQQVSALSGRPILYVPGNHEFYGQEMKTGQLRMEEACMGSHVQVLNARRVIMGGVRFLGCTLWTNFSMRLTTADGLLCSRADLMDVARYGMNDYREIRLRTEGSDRLGSLLSPEDTVRIHGTHRAWLRRQLKHPWAGPTVVITHHAPSTLSLPPEHATKLRAAAYATDLPSSMFEGVALWVHGHVHHSVDYAIGDCRVFSNPRGYPVGRDRHVQNERFDGGCVIEV